VQRAKSHVRFLIVTVADPVETGDTLRFDRTLETVQSAVEGLDYSFAGYWIPWSDADKGKAARHTPCSAGPAIEEPGSLVFRGVRETLVVFLVGESAVFGIRPLQFLRSVSYLKVFSPAPEVIRIAGPNYSGSLESLRVAIDQASANGCEIECVRVISPSATVLKAGEEFRRAPSNGKPAIEYNSVVHNDSYVTARFLSYIQRRWFMDPSGLAVLRESSTLFGRGVPAKTPVVVQFPRGIFRLRNASPEATGRALFAPEAGSAAPHERLRLTLRGPQAGEERVPSLASDQAPVVQEAVLLGISAVLRQEGVKFAQIISSDVYDSIFLAGFLKRAYPQVRPYFFNADLLNVRASEVLPLEGALSVTTFPLIVRNQIWSRPAGQGTRLLPVSSRFEAGIHNAICALLDGRGADDENLGALERSFNGSFFRGRPPLWLTVVGTNGYWPIALLDMNDSGDQDPLLLGCSSNSGAMGNGASSPSESESRPRWPSPGEPSWLWSMVFAILLLAGYVLGTAVIVGQRASCHSTRLLPAAWEVRPGEPGAAGRAYFAMSANLVMAGMIFTMAGPACLVLFSAPGFWDICRFVASFGAIALLIAAAAAPWKNVLDHRAGAKQVEDIKPRIYGACSAITAIGFVVFVVLWCLSMAGGAKMEGFFFCYRSFDLLNGVNPVMPFLFLGLGLLLLIFLHQTRHAMIVELPRNLPSLDADPLVRGLSAEFLKAKEPLSEPLVSTHPANRLIAGAGCLTILVLPLFERQQSLEGIWFDALYWATLVLFNLVVVLTWARFLAVSIHLKGPMDRLAVHPLHHAFAALPPGQAPCTILRGRCRTGASEVLTASLHALRAAASVPGQKLQHALKRRLAIAEMWMGRNLVPAGAGAHRTAEVHYLLAGTGTLVAGELALNWSGGGPPVHKAPAPENEFNSLGAHFVALQYAVFLGNIMVQLQNLLWFVVTGFFLGIVSTLVYPFRAQYAFVWAGTINFVLLGLPVLVAIMQIERHPLLQSTAGRENSYRTCGSLAKIALYFSLPLIGLIGSHFPELGRYLVTLLQPAMQTMR
jgi:hypothetical protein